MAFRYRNDSLWGSGNRCLAKVVIYEIDELDNYDMLAPLLTAKERKAASDCGTASETKAKLGIGDDEILRRLGLWSKKRFGREPSELFCLWLASKEAVIEQYDGNETSKNIERHDVAGCEVYDDLGYDGKLFVSAKPI